MLTLNSTYYAALAKHAKEREEFVELLRLAKADSEKKTSALTKTTRELEQANDNLKSVSKEYKDLKRAVKDDFKKVYDLAEEITEKDPKDLWTHSSGRPIPLAESRISMMTFAIGCEYHRKCEKNDAYEKMVKEFNTKLADQKDEIAAYKKGMELARKAKEMFKSKFNNALKTGSEAKEALLKSQKDLINSQREVQQLKDLLVQRAAENKKLEDELDSRFCRFVDTLTGGGKKRKLNSTFSTALTLRDSKDD